MNHSPNSSSDLHYKHSTVDVNQLQLPQSLCISVYIDQCAVSASLPPALAMPICISLLGSPRGHKGNNRRKEIGKRGREGKDQIWRKLDWNSVQNAQRVKAWIIEISSFLGKMAEYLEQLCSRNVMVIPYSHICNAAGESLSFSLLNGA